MASADLSFTKDGLIYRPDHQEEEEDDFLVEHARKDGGELGGEPTGQAASIEPLLLLTCTSLLAAQREGPSLITFP